MDIKNIIMRKETKAHWFWENMNDEAKEQCTERALRVYFRYKAIFNEWVEENIEPSAECVLEALRHAEDRK